MTLLFIKDGSLTCQRQTNKQTKTKTKRDKPQTHTHTHTLNKTSIRHGIKTSYTCFCYLRQLDKNEWKTFYSSNLFSIKLEPKKNLAFCKKLWY